MGRVGGRLPGSVQAARGVALEVHGDEAIAGGANACDDPRAQVDQASDLGRLDLDPGDLAVVAHADLAEAQGVYGVLRGLDPGQRLQGHLGPVRDAGGEARERGLVPVGQPEPPCGGADVRLGHTGLQQREADPPPDGGAVPRPVVAGVVGVRAIGEVRQPEPGTDGFERPEQLLLAVEAAVRAVAPVGLELHLAGVDLDQVRPELLGEGAGRVLFGRGIGW